MRSYLGELRATRCRSIHARSLPFVDRGVSATDNPVGYAVTKWAAFLGTTRSCRSEAPLYAVCSYWWRSAFVSVQITIRGVPDEVRNELAARAAMQRQSMQEFLLGELERIASRPTVGAWLRGVRDRKEISATEVGAAAILRERDTDRRE